MNDLFIEIIEILLFVLTTGSLGMWVSRQKAMITSLKSGDAGPKRMDALSDGLSALQISVSSNKMKADTNEITLEDALSRIRAIHNKMNQLNRSEQKVLAMQQLQEYISENPPQAEEKGEKEYEVPTLFETANGEMIDYR